jgi:hypothetical protein
MKIEKDLYIRDFYAWTQQSARLIREGRFGELDLEHIAEERESMGADGVLIATKETELDESSFPENCPYSLEQVLCSEFLPE